MIGELAVQVKRYHTATEAKNRARPVENRRDVRVRHILISSALTYPYSEAMRSLPEKNARKS
jgi:hypothetical protein